MIIFIFNPDFSFYQLPAFVKTNFKASFIFVVWSPHSIGLDDQVVLKGSSQ